MFEGGLAELLRFLGCQVEKVRKSRRIAAFLLLSNSKTEEVSSFVFKLADRHIDREITITVTATVSTTTHTLPVQLQVQNILRYLITLHKLHYKYYNSNYYKSNNNNNSYYYYNYLLLLLLLLLLLPQLQLQLQPHCTLLVLLLHIS